MQKSIFGNLNVNGWLTKRRDWSKWQILKGGRSPGCWGLTLGGWSSQKRWLLCSTSLFSSSPCDCVPALTLASLSSESWIVLYHSSVGRNKLLLSQRSPSPVFIKVMKSRVKKKKNPESTIKKKCGPGDIKAGFLHTIARSLPQKQHPWKMQLWTRWQVF